MHARRLTLCIPAALLLVCLGWTSSAYGAGNAPQPSICSRGCWGARAPQATIYQMGGLNRAIVHHTAGNEFNTTGYEDSKARVRAIQNYHMDTNGWSDIGYHFLVDKYGYIFEGRSGSLTSLPRGAHDAVNSNSFGMNVMGYFHTPVNNQPTAAMLDSLYDLIAWRMPAGWQPYGWPGTSYGSLGNQVGYIDGHRRVNPTACPGDLMFNPYMGTNINAGAIRAEVNARVVGGTAYDATYHGQSYPGVMYPGQSVVAWVEYTNIGNNSWDNTNTRLGTSNPRDRSSAFFTSGNWINAGRPSAVDSATPKNSIGRFTFMFTAPQTAGYYVENWELVQEGVTWFENGGDNAWFGVEVAKQGDNVGWECEDYTRGVHAGNGTDYYDTTGGNSGGAYRSQDVDIRDKVGGGYQVGWTAAGEWLRYYYYGGGNSYRWSVAYSNGSGSNASIRLRVDGADVGTVDLPATANYDTFATAIGHVAIASAGLHELKLEIVSGAPDLDSFRLDREWNPPFSFTYNLQGFDFFSVWNNGMSAPTWTDCCGWPGIMYADQTGNDGWFYSGCTNFAGAASDVIHVRVYPQAGTGANHDMQVFFITQDENYWDSAKSSSVVYFTAQDTWADVYIDVGSNAKWAGKQITQLRVDVDQNNQGTRWIIDSITVEQQVQVPAAPGGLAATAISKNQVDLGWTDNANNESNFVVARSTTSGGPYTDIATLGANVTSYSDTSCAPSTTYYYVVRASNAAGSSANSNEASATTPADLPEAPSGLTATAAGWADINLAWTDNSGNETNFVVARSAAAGGPYSDIATLSANSTSYTNTGLNPNTTYYYVVRATNAGGSSPDSAEASATTLNQPPNAPSGLTATAVSTSQINLAWTDNSTNESNFVVARSATTGGPYTDIATLAANSTSYNNTGLSANTTYYYVVRAVNNGGASANSNQASATTPILPPAAPSGLTATAASGTQINLAWTDNADNEANIVVARAAVSGGPYTDIATLGANSTTYADSGLSENATYYYVVRATNAGGASANSNQASATTPVPDRIIDNSAAVVTGSWSTGTSAPDKYGADYRFRGQGVGANTVAFIPTFGIAASYRVYEWHPQGSNRSTVAPHIVNFSGASDTVTVNQQTGGGAWNLIGTFNFAAGSGGSVTITDTITDPPNQVMADAIKFVYNGAAIVPTVPTGLAATAASPTQVNLTWANALNETGYVVARATASGGPYTDIGSVGANGTSFQDTGCSENTTYYYVVRATNAAGASANSAQAGATTPLNPPAAPGNLTASASVQTKVNLSWTDNSGTEANFVVAFATTTGGPYTDIATLAANTTTYQHTGRSASTTYYYVVRATNAGGASANSNEASITTPAPTVVVIDGIGAEDGYVYETAAGSGVGGTVNTANGVTPMGDTSANRAYRSFYSFDTSSIPDDATVIRGTLSVMQYNINGGDPWATLGTLVVDIANGYFSTSTGLESADYQAGAGATAVATVPKPGGNGVRVTTNLNANGIPYVNKTGKTQLKLRFTTATNSNATNDYVNLYTASHADTTKWPRFEVEYIR